jgi:hypothetical protein
MRATRPTYASVLQNRGAGLPHPALRATLSQRKPVQVMSVGAVYDRALFLESTKYARSQTAPTANAPLLGQAPKGRGPASPVKCSIWLQPKAAL